MKAHFLIAGLILTSTLSAAQVLKKLKDKVEQKVEKTVNSNSSSSSNPSNNTPVNANTQKIMADYCQQVYKLADGESMAYSESKLGFGADQKGYKITIKTKNGYKLLENGKVTPVAAPPAELLKAENAALKKQNLLSDEESRANFVKTNAQYEQVVTFKGKVIATFKMLQGIVATKDKAHLYATGSEFNGKEMVNFLVSEDGKKTKLPALPMAILISDDGTLGGAAVSEYNIQAEKTGNADISTMNTMYVFLSNGTKQNITMEDLSTTWIHKSGKLLTYKNNQILSEGKTLFTLGNNTSGDVFVNDNLTLAVRVSEGAIEFSDGVKPDWAYSIKKVTTDGKTYFSWFTVDFSTKTIYLCKREF